MNVKNYCNLTITVAVEGGPGMGERVDKLLSGMTITLSDGTHPLGGYNLEYIDADEADEEAHDDAEEAERAILDELSDLALAERLAEEAELEAEE